MWQKATDNPGLCSHLVLSQRQAERSMIGPNQFQSQHRRNLIRHIGDTARDAVQWSWSATP